MTISLLALNAAKCNLNVLHDSLNLNLSRHAFAVRLKRLVICLYNTYT